MQELIDISPNRIPELFQSFSTPRMTRYITEAHGNNNLAFKNYHWNSLLAQSFHFPLHIWEISLRNRINEFLCEQYQREWPYDEKRALRQLTKPDQRRVAESRLRQERKRRQSRASTDAIVADLSAGFWVSLLSERYATPFAWRYNLGRVFRHDQSLDRQSAHRLCEEILILRNRIAHHEPIHHLPLQQRHADLERIVESLCLALVNIFGKPRISPLRSRSAPA